MNKFVARMLELGAELDQAASPIEISMVINDAEILYENHIKQLTMRDVVARGEQFNCLGGNYAKGIKECEEWCGEDMCQKPSI